MHANMFSMRWTHTLLASLWDMGPDVPRAIIVIKVRSPAAARARKQVARVLCKLLRRRGNKACIDVGTDLFCTHRSSTAEQLHLHIVGGHKCLCTHRMT